MTARKLTEQGTLIADKAKEGVFPIRIITEGQGSSGVYSAELLKQYGEVFANRPMHMNHPKDPNAPWERDILGIAARTGEVRVDKDEQGRTALYTEAKVRKEYREFIEEFGDLIGVSIYASGEGREENGQWIVESFDGSDPYTSVDFVVAAGRGGRVEKMMESYRAIENSTGQPADDGTTTVADRNTTETVRNLMEIEEIAKKVDTLAESVASLLAVVTPLVESLKPAEVTEVDTDFSTVAEAVVEAGLPKEAREAVYESVKAGAAVESAIAKQKALVESVRKAVEAEVQHVAAAGRIVEAGGNGDFKFDVFGGKA